MYIHTTEQVEKQLIQMHLNKNTEKPRMNTTPTVRSALQYLHPIILCRQPILTCKVYHDWVSYCCNYKLYNIELLVQSGQLLFHTTSITHFLNNFQYQNKKIIGNLICSAKHIIIEKLRITIFKAFYKVSKFESINVNRCRIF